MTSKKNSSHKSILILGVRVDKITFKESLALSKRLIKSKGRHYIVTPNPEIIVAARKDSHYRDILNGSDLSIPDGIGLVVISNILGYALPERVTGIDLLEALVRESEKEGFNLFLLGGGVGVAEISARVLKERYPKLKIVGTFGGVATKKGDEETLNKIGKQQIDVLVVAYGPGKQEKWINRNLGKLDVRLAIGVGGALDFISGKKSRAPKFIQRIGMEWVFRLLKEPWRLKRQLALPIFAYLFFIEKMTKGRI